MSRHLPGDLEPQPDEKPRRRILGLLDRRSWLFLGMGLAGILTVALIVTADESYAGIDGMRAIRALVPDNETDHPEAPSIPVLGGLVAAIHDLAPLFFAPPADPTAPGPSDPSSGPANSPSSPAGPTTSPVPAAQLPGSTTAPPTSTAGPTASPSNSAAPMSPSPSAASSPTPSPTPAPNVALATDRGATAIVDLTDLVPGDSMDRTITVQNTGSLAFRYTLSAMQTASTPLWTDATDGLQLTVRTTGGTILYTGPLSGVGFVAGPTTLAPGTSETLRYTFAFPASASNGLQGLIQDLTFVFDAVEFP